MDASLFGINLGFRLGASAFRKNQKRQKGVPSHESESRVLIGSSNLTQHSVTDGFPLSRFRGFVRACLTVALFVLLPFLVILHRPGLPSGVSNLDLV